LLRQYTRLGGTFQTTILLSPGTESASWVPMWQFTMKWWFQKRYLTEIVITFLFMNLLENTKIATTFLLRNLLENKVNYICITTWSTCL